jgi:hypothetical protein
VQMETTPTTIHTLRRHEKLNNSHSESWLVPLEVKLLFHFRVADSKKCVLVWWSVHALNTSPLRLSELYGIVIVNVLSSLFLICRHWQLPDSIVGFRLPTCHMLGALHVFLLGKQSSVRLTIQCTVLVMLLLQPCYVTLFQKIQSVTWSCARSCFKLLLFQLLYGSVIFDSLF